MLFSCEKCYITSDSTLWVSFFSKNITVEDNFGSTGEPKSQKWLLGAKHHLHPFYYRGKLMKYYDCAIEDEWRPFSVDQHQKKIQKTSPPKKYEDKPIPKKRFSTKTNRNDASFSDPSKLEQDHAKFISEINGMTEKRPTFSKYRILVADNDDDLMDLDSMNFHPYRLHEHPFDAEKPSVKFRNQPPMISPFQRYKKFRVITVKPPNVKVKRVSPAHLKPASDPQADPRGRLTAQTFSTKQADGKDNGLGTRKGKHFYPHRPQLTLLEKFLILFPKFI